MGSKQSSDNSLESLTNSPDATAGSTSSCSDAGLPDQDLDQLGYGGQFAWVDAHYKMKVTKGISPLQWLNGFTKRMLVLEDILFASDGTFRCPFDGSRLFPKHGIDLRWRWDAEQKLIMIDFWRKNELLKWRWDELTPSAELRFPSTVPDLSGVGHVGKFSFVYELRSAVEDPFMSVTHLSSSGDAESHTVPTVPLAMSEDQLRALEPVTREGATFSWWRKCMDAQYKRQGFDGMGLAFCMPPPETVLGMGAYGVVWLARSRESGFCFAVKNLMVRRGASVSEAMARNEFQIAEKICLQPHPGIVALLSVDSFELPHGGLYMLVMEFCHGGDLQQALDKCVDVNGRYVPPDKAQLWIGQIFLAVEHIHVRLNLLIRDLKPSNVVLSSSGCAKLTDFGYGRLIAESPGGEWTFAAPPGSPGYAAPEVLAQEPYTYPADVYSLGVVIWVMLSGGMKSRDQVCPPTAGEGKDFCSYEQDWKLLKSALRDAEQVRCLIDDVTIEAVSAMTQPSQLDRPSCEMLRSYAFFREGCLPCAEIGELTADYF
eukprot:TRINITY_DN110060_c0_g1_i1.p1 TRINITY_DN110060_c0_g1~~TRINITY_DN110060_c0_g1_i1.p1  ORF type:complete len:551 (+),score=116.81 TRINITY_DN110060_c0_g1_i1:26-1654(+)